MDFKAWAVAAAVAACASVAAAAAAAPVSFQGHAASPDAFKLAAWVARSGDADGKAFAIVDKKAARIFVFDAGWRLVGASHALLGQTVGDHTAEGVGARAQTGTVRPGERTTPAGRFATTAGRNLNGEAVIWLDYDAAFAIHRVRPGAGLADRIARLQSPTPDDNRASLGCVVVPVDFYLGVVQPLLARAGALVYVLPEHEDWDGVLAPQL
jgi:hypothetical protein